MSIILFREREDLLLDAHVKTETVVISCRYTLKQLKKNLHAFQWRRNY